MKLLITLTIIIGIVWGFTHPRVESVKVKAYTVSNITPSVTPSPTPLPLHSEIMIEVIRIWGEKPPAEILKILECFNSESEFKFNAINAKNRNKSVDFGPAQINSVHTKRFGNKFKTDWKENLRVAKQIYDEQGLKPWYGKRCS